MLGWAWVLILIPSPAISHPPPTLSLGALSQLLQYLVCCMKGLPGRADLNEVPLHTPTSLQFTDRGISRAAPLEL